MTRIYAMVAAGVLLALLAGLFLITFLRPQSDDTFAMCRESQVAGGTDLIGGPFELVNSKGETVTDRDVLSGPSLVYFGYTFCPDICPLDTVRNADAADILAERGKELTPVFITVDPKRDTPEAMGIFASNIHDRMIGLSGSEDQVRSAVNAYRAYYKVHDADDDEFYLVDHSTFSYLVLPEYGFVEYYRRDIEADELADKIGCFLDAA